MCTHTSVARLRDMFFTEMLEKYKVNLPYVLGYSPLTPGEVLHILLHRPDTRQAVAQYVYDLFKLVQQTPLLVVEMDSTGPD